MQLLKFSIRELLILVVLVALSATAFANVGNRWATAYCSFVIFALLIATLAVVFGRSSRRSFWAGFAFLGWSYLGLVYGWTGLSDGNLVTTELLTEAANHFAGGSDATLDSGGLPILDEPSLPLQVNSTESLHRIGHAAWALFFAIVGGIVARFLEASNETESS